MEILFRARQLVEEERVAVVGQVHGEGLLGRARSLRMQGDLDAELLREVVPIVATHANGDVRLMQGLVELELRRRHSVAQVYALGIRAQKRWLLQVELLERGPHATQLGLGNRGPAVREELVGAAGRVHVLGAARRDMLASRVVIELLLRELVV